MPTAKTTQKMFEFPPVGQFDPTWICLVTRSMHPVTAVPCLLGFIGLVCGDDFEKVLDGADKDGLALEAVELSGAELRQRLSDLMIDWYPAVTMDDFYVLLGIQLCNLFCRRGSDVNCGWYQTRAGAWLNSSRMSPVKFRCDCMMRRKQTPSAPLQSGGFIPGPRSTALY
ncbi:hypothetical protein HPB51_027152 [Rhipicephalus microplus]|uniref:Uncharacterized protein n=1 Tax=Rhipicephalus microplus TaxID=6941 RepID=A0A9J6D125_RHIMP|nr:hypothetical protein HPB51_027152 [Rhipicephalus microplus]